MLTRLSRFGPGLSRALSGPPARFISQSKPSGVGGSTSVAGTLAAAEPAGHGEVSQFVKNPDYHGFSTDPAADERNMRVGFFFGISVAIVIGGTFIHYLPDHGMKQWARREAELVIVQREKDGLPLIHENYYDTNKIIFPTDGGA
ncbi:NADH dehydrogenase [ubiquinone] 1 beta subcomplex subunit 11, mitochondrial [Brachionichthys hirsutus]|uniref:NADH dehydrogenase [ubiquinone] 1 beta subcomplex subunit 11, mitochondrial n=1 Tax=Brachionichthys hirsutus TaxID=412623 RepID=UPI003604EBDD